MVYDKNNISARTNQIKILSSLQSDLGFNELRYRVGLTQKTLNKWIERFLKKNYIEKVGTNKRKKYEITKKGTNEYRRLLTEEKANKVLVNLDLIDSVNIEKKDIQGFSCEGTLPISNILTDEKRKAMGKEIDEKVLPILLKVYKDYDVISGQAIFRVHKNKTKIIKEVVIKNNY